MRNAYSIELVIRLPGPKSHPMKDRMFELCRQQSINVLFLKMEGRYVQVIGKTFFRKTKDCASESICTEAKDSVYSPF
jgi:hypothetical protein